MEASPHYAHVQRLKTDLKSFADQHVEPEVVTDGGMIHASWTRQGQEKEAFFSVIGDEELAWLPERDDGVATEASYDAFLMSGGLANFRFLAEQTLLANEEMSNFVPSTSQLGEAALHREGDKTDEALMSVDTFLGLVDKSRIDGDSLTDVLFVKGPPGTGKTTLLEQSTREAAARFMAGEGGFLTLYVSAQGRELSNLKDALAAELEELGSPFPSRAIYPLCRRGLLVPIIDGFDELLGTKGYGGAFSSLQDMFRNLAGLGAVVVSARTAFYDQQMADRLKAPSTGADISISTVNLKPWNKEQLLEFLSKEGDIAFDATELLGAYEKLRVEDQELLARPFFAAQFPEYLTATADSPSKAPLVGYLIDNYVDREAAKYVDANLDPLLPPDAHHYLRELAAELMWTSETRQLTQEDLRTIVELVSEERGMTSEDIESLKEKITNTAGFDADGDGTSDLTFEHEVYFDYFLGRGIARSLDQGSPEDAVRLMDAGQFSADAVRTAATYARTIEVARQLANNAHHSNSENQRANRGALAVAMINQRPEDMRGLECANLDFFGQIVRSPNVERVVFRHCRFSICDVSQARFEECVAEHTEFHELRVSDRSLLDISGISSRNVTSLDLDGMDRAFEPTMIDRVLLELGAPLDGSGGWERALDLSPRAEKIGRMLDRVAATFRTQNLLFDDSTRVEKRHEKLLKDPEWPLMRDLLVGSGCLQLDQNHQHSGSHCDVLRLKVKVEELIQARFRPSDDKRIEEFWSELSKV